MSRSPERSAEVRANMTPRSRERRRAFGSVIPHRGRSDEWLITLSLGYGADGKRIRCVKVVHGSEVDADRALADLITKKRNRATQDPGRMTVEE